MTRSRDEREPQPSWGGSYHITRIFGVAQSVSGKLSSAEMDGREVFHYSIPNVQEFGSGVKEDGSSIASDKLLITEASVLISKLNPRKSTICHASPQRITTVASTEFIPLRTGGPDDDRYLFWVLSSPNIARYLSALVTSTTNSHQRVQPADVLGLDVPWPSPPIRRAIADYLDRETGEIDAMIAKMEELEETLEIRRKAVVLGVLEELPSRIRLTLILDVVSGSGFPDKYQGLSGEELPFYKVSSLSSAKCGRLGEAENSVSRDVADELRARVIPSGSVVMAKIGAALLLARYALTTRPACIDNNMQALVPREGLVDSRFLSYAMEEVSVHSLVKPGPVPSLDVMGMKMTDVAYHPSLDEQRRIAEHLDEVTGKIDAMLAKVAELKSLLVERRAALIIDVVTGRKKVA